MAMTLPFYRMPFSSTPSFTLAMANNTMVFAMLLSGNVSSSTLSGIGPGQVIGFYIEQDQAGGHTFVYPQNVKGANAPQTYPGAISFQFFVMNDDGNMYALGIGVFL